MAQKFQLQHLSAARARPQWQPLVSLPERRPASGPRSRIRDYANQERPEGMINWSRSREIAVGMNRGETLTAVERERLDEYYGELGRSLHSDRVGVHRCACFQLPIQRTYAFDRVDWIEANLVGFPANVRTDRGPGLARRATGAVWPVDLQHQPVGPQLRNRLDAWISRPTGARSVRSRTARSRAGGGCRQALLRGAEHPRRSSGSWALPKDDFRMWLALHETTHVFEFEAYPWVRVHFNTLA